MSEGRALQVRGRAALCDTLESVGPDAPTMCEGWRALDLAAHLSVRENDSWTAPVIVCGQLSGLVARMVARERALGFAKIVARLRSGPPWLFRSTPLTVRLNTVEDWIHHEDVRRAQGLGPLPSSAELDDVLWKGVSSAGKVTGMRLDDVGLEAVSSVDGRRHTVRRGARMVSVAGPPGEVLLFVTGRTSVAQVTLSGPDDAVSAMRRARLNL